VRFFIDASLPRNTAPHIKGQGHDAADVRDIGLGSADDDVIAAHSQSHQMCLLTRDYDFADIRNYPPNQYFGLVVFELPNQALVNEILNLVDALLQKSDILNNLPGRLAIVEPGRIRLRPTP
jgi:predicted nuclease of predicted toxin-antitoxin system